MTNKKLEFFTADQGENVKQPAIDFLVHPVLPMRDVTLMVGDEPRSILALQLAANTACGPNFLGFGAARGPVVYCSEVKDAETISNWIAGFTEEEGIGSYDVRNIHICTPPAGYKTLATKDDKSGQWHASEEWKALKKKVKKERPALFVFDADLDPDSDAEYADQIVAQMRSLAAEFNLVSMLVVQSAKSGDAPQWAESIGTHWIAKHLPPDDDPYKPECDLLVRRFQPVETQMDLYQRGSSFSSYGEVPF